MELKEQLKKTQEELRARRSQLQGMVKESQILGQEIFKLEGEKRWHRLGA